MAQPLRKIRQRIAPAVPKGGFSFTLPPLAAGAVCIVMLACIGWAFFMGYMVGHGQNPGEEMRELTGIGRPDRETLAEMDKALAMSWIKDTHTQEIAEIATMNLYQHLPFAPELAITLIETDDDMMQIQGYSILSKHFSKDNANIDKDLSYAYLKNITMALQNSNIAVKHSAWNSIVKFSDIDQECNSNAKTALKSIKMDDWL